MYLCTSIIQYIVTYRHKKLRKFDKKNTGFSRPAKDFHLFNCQRTETYAARLSFDEVVEF